MQDTGHILFNAFGCGTEQREILDQQIKSGERSFRDVSEEMWGSLNVPFADGFEAMKEGLDIDPEFKTFHQFCLNNNIPFNVISAGLKPVLRSVLDHFWARRLLPTSISLPTRPRSRKTVRRGR
jgi:2-hydroxy-3-keto-5-methylthiopentenyl-1-phosphate phosphatase